MYRADDGSPLWIGPPTRELSLYALRKCFAHQITKSSAVWWFDMWGGWFADPLLMEELLAMRGLYETNMAEKPKNTVLCPEVAFFADEQAYASLFNCSPQMRGAVETRTALGKTGIPFDSVMVEDAEALVTKYKAAIFPFPVFSEAGKRAVALCKAAGIPYLCATAEKSAFSKEELRAFLDKCGVQSYGDLGEVVYLGYGYIGLHSAIGGRKTLRLPVPMEVSAVYGTDFEKKRTDTVEFDLEENATALFLLS